MRVCLDARCLRCTVTGLGRYAEHLIRGLAAIDRRTDYVLILDPSYPRTVVDQPNFSFVRLPGRPDTVGNFLRGARKIEPLKADVYHSLHHFLPLGIKGNVVLTLHDLMLIEHPDITFPNRWQGYIVKAYAEVTLKYSLNRADHVIAISQFTAQRANALLDVPYSRMTVIPHGVEKGFFMGGGPPPPNVEQSPFFLMVGHSKPHKNVGRVLGALALLAQRLPEIRLRLVGRGDGYDQLREQAASLGISDRVEFLKNVPDDELLSMYRAAVALVLPSLVEGFGLPVLEAQAIGCPVITSNRGALPETAGDAALLVDPLDSWDIARAMELLYRDSRLRASLIERGRARAREFTWERTAARTRDVYNRLAGSEHVTRRSSDHHVSVQTA